MSIEVLDGAGANGDEELPSTGTQTMNFYEGYYPEFNGSGLPTSDSAPYPSQKELMQRYEQAMQGDLGNPETVAAAERLQVFLGATGLNSPSNNN